MEAEDMNAWLHAPAEQPAKLAQLTTVEVLDAAPAVD
jgi:hypothetical protein